MPCHASNSIMNKGGAHEEQEEQYALLLLGAAGGTCPWATMAAPPPLCCLALTCGGRCEWSWRDRGAVGAAGVGDRPGVLSCYQNQQQVEMLTAALSVGAHRVQGAAAGRRWRAAHLWSQQGAGL